MKNLQLKNLALRRYALGMSIAGIAAAALLTTIAAPVSAQAGGSMTAQQALHDLKASYGVMIIPRDGVDLNTRVNASVVANPAGGPTQAVARLANAMDARSRMVFIVVPATADRPVTTLSDAKSFDSAGGTVTLHLSGLPAGDAIRAVAAADNSAVDLRSDVGARPVDLDGTDMTVAEAVAQIASQTNTHWIQAYELIPPAPVTMARGTQFHRSRPFVTMSVDSGPTGPVYFHPTPPPPPPVQQAPADQSDQGTNNQGANTPAAQAVPVVPVNPNPPYFVMQNGYAYTPDGVPYPQTWSGFSNGGGYVPGSGIYLSPGFGSGWFGGSPVVFGGSSTTAPF